jgi:flagellar motor switch protein FliN
LSISVDEATAQTAAESPNAAAPQAGTLSGGRASTAALPSYARNLLRISVPVTVTLAEKKQPLDRIVELAPGSIIQFDKSCEQMLDLSAAGRKIAEGEAVKVGDKFGLRITSIVLPDERFEPVRPGPPSSSRG